MRIHCPGCGASGELQRSNPDTPVACPRCGARWYPEPFDSAAADQPHAGRAQAPDDEPGLHHSLCRTAAAAAGLAEVRCPRCLAVTAQPVARLHLPAPCPRCHFLVEFEPLHRPRTRPRRSRSAGRTPLPRSNRLGLALALGVPLLLLLASGAWLLHARNEQRRREQQRALAELRAAQEQAEARRAAALEALAHAHAERLAREALRRERERQRSEEREEAPETEPETVKSESNQAQQSTEQQAAAAAPPPSADLEQQRREAERARVEAAREAREREAEARRLAERFAPRRAALDAALARAGGDERLRDAIEDALDWLVRHQDPDGGWSATGFARQCTAAGCLGPDYRSPGRTGRGLGDPRFDVGLTALGLLALLGDGHEPLVAASPERRDAARSAVRYLLAHQNADGSFGYDGRDQSIYNHVLALQALAECAIATEDRALRVPLLRALQWVRLAQSDDGGWGYTPRSSRPDTSVTCFTVLALWTARAAGFEVEEAAGLGALRWIERCTPYAAPDGERWLVGYRKPGDGGSRLNPRTFPHPHSLPEFTPTPGLTAAAVAARLVIGQPADAEPITGGLEHLASAPPRWEVDLHASSVDLVYALWGSLATALADGDGARAQHWARWSPALETALLGGTDGRRQRRDGDARGSWDPVGAWGAVGGRVYATAMAALCLESWQLRASWRARLANTTLAGATVTQLERQRRQREQALRATVLRWLTGRKRYVCGNCGGRRRVQCRQCEGLGVERFGPVANQHIIRCRRCGGSGALRCSRCASRNDGLDPRDLERAEQRYGAAGSPLRTFDRRSLELAVPLFPQEPVRVTCRVKLRGQDDETVESSVWREDDEGRWRTEGGS